MYLLRTDSMDDLPPDAESPTPALYIAHHSLTRSFPTLTDTLRTAQDAGYDLLTTRITTPTFHSRVLSTLRNHTPAPSTPSPLLSSLTPADSTLEPSESNSSLLALVSPWISLGSPDPIVAHLSQQVLSLEVAYAAFCGVSNVVIPAPLEDEDVLKYARVVSEALGMGPYLQVHVLMPMKGRELELEVLADGERGLAEFVRGEYVVAEGEDEAEEGEVAEFGSWEVWNRVREFCGYSARLSIGMQVFFPFIHQSKFSLSHSLSHFLVPGL